MLTSVVLASVVLKFVTGPTLSSETTPSSGLHAQCQSKADIGAEERAMIIPVAIIRWIAAKVLAICALIVLLVIIAVPAALCLMRAFFEPVPTSAEPVTGVKLCT
jgi:hypothetical protein